MTVGRLRALVLAAYCVNGFSLSAWMVRLPGIADTLGLDAADLGTFLLAGALGTLGAVPVAGVLVQRLGGRTVYALAAAVFAVAYGGLGWALSGPGFGALLAANVVHGVAYALTNVAQSVVGVHSERRAGRTILPQFHAMFSVGAAAGAAAGGLAAAVGITPAAQLFGLVVAAGGVRAGIALLLTDGTIGRVPRQPAEAPTARRPGARRYGRRLPALRSSVWVQPRTLLLGLVIFGASLSEGVANSWMAPAMVEAFATEESTAAVSVSVFLVAQTVGRVLGGALVDRTGRTAALRLSGLVSAAGIVLFAVAPSVTVAMVGAGVWGLGAALSVPVAISAAADTHNAAARIAAVTSLASLSRVVGPPLLGAVGDVTGLRTAIGTVAVVVVVGALVARRATRPDP